MATNALREVFALFGIKYNTSGEKRAEKGLKNLKNVAKKTNKNIDNISNSAKKAQINIGSFFKGFGITLGIETARRGFMNIINAASDADETLNVLNESFGGSTQAVLDFSRIAADEVGRSEFQLREFAGTIGAVVTPMLAKMGDQAQVVSSQISNDFSKLAVDLSSFFNTSEKDAIEALRSGLTGQSEPLLKFGVVALQQNLAEFAGMSVGDFGKLDQAQKTLIRYRFIMQQTAKAQGDAARTADGFANVSRAVLGRLRGLAVVLGRKVVPYLESFLAVTRDSIKWITKVIEKSNVLQAAFTLASAAALVFGARAIIAGRSAIIAWVKAAAPAILLAAAVTLVVLAIDDLITAMNGGDSVFGKWLDKQTGVKDSAVLLKQVFQDLGSAIYDLFHGGGTALDSFVTAWREGFATLLKSMEPVLDVLGKVFGFSGADIIAKVRGTNEDNLNRRGLTAQRGLDASMASQTRTVAGGVAVQERGLTAASRPGIRRIRNKPSLSNEQKNNIGSATRDLGLVLPSPQIPTAPIRSFSREELTTENKSKIEQNINITVNGGNGTPKQIGNATEKSVRRLLREERRKVTESVGGNG